MSDKRFMCGFGIACSEMVRSHGEATLAYYLMSGAGFSYADFVKAGLDEYDLEPIRQAFAENAPMPARGAKLEREAL